MIFSFYLIYLYFFSQWTLSIHFITFSFLFHSLHRININWEILLKMAIMKDEKFPLIGMSWWISVQIYWKTSFVLPFQFSNQSVVGNQNVCIRIYQLTFIGVHNTCMHACMQVIQMFCVCLFVYFFTISSLLRIILIPV